MWSILRALRLAWEKQIFHLVVESDCSTVVALLQDVIHESHLEFELLSEIQLLMNESGR